MAILYDCGMAALVQAGSDQTHRDEAKMGIGAQRSVLLVAANKILTCYAPTIHGSQEIETRGDSADWDLCD